MPPLPGLGSTLRSIRLSRGYSLSQVGTGTGLSTSFLSLVEQGKSDITLGRLMNLIKFYNVGLTDLVPEPTDMNGVVVRRDQRRELHLETEGIEIVLLAPDTNRTMMPVISTFAPGGQTANHALHEGEEFVWVLSGSIVLEIAGSDPILLEEGDSAYFDASRAHQYKNPSDEPTKVLAVITPPTL